MSTADTFDQRYLRHAKGVPVPAHTETDRTFIARPIPNRGGNAHVSDHHLFTAENHIPLEDFNQLDFIKRGWIALLALSVIGMFALFGVMIARG